MGTGDSPEMQRMQDEAIQRAREMRRRAQLPPTEEEIPEGEMKKNQVESSSDQNTNGEGHESTGVNEPTVQQSADKDPVEQDQSDQHPQRSNTKEPKAPPGESVPSLLDNLFKNHEQTLILILLILIGGESDNHELMFALLFLLM